MFNKSDQLNELFKALAEAQKELKNPPKSKTAKIPLKNGGTKEYSYADLAQASDMFRPILAKYGLSLLQPLVSTEKGDAIFTVLAHSSGQYIESMAYLPVPQNPTAQEIGSALTYLRRYAALSILGLQGDEDDDGEEVSKPIQKPIFSAPKAISPMNHLVQVATECGFTTSQMTDLIKSKFNKTTSKELTKEEVEILVNYLDENRVKR